MRLHLRPLFITAACLTGLYCALVPETARADFALGADLDFAEGLTGRAADAGGGVALRIGSQFDLPLMTLALEGLGSHHGFEGNDEVAMTRGLFGARLRVGEVLEPGVFGHVGIGHLSGWDSYTAPALDVGLSLDLTLLPLIDVGVHGAYNVLVGMDDHRAFTFYTLGLHAALVL